MKIQYNTPEHAKITLGEKHCDGYCIPLGKANLILIKTDTGIIACGFIDMNTCEKLDIAAAKITGITTIEELLTAQIKDTTKKANEMNIHPGITGHEALNILLNHHQ